MTYTLRFDERPQYLFAEVHAEHTTPDLVHRYMTEMHDMCVRTGHRHLLVRRDIPDTLTMGNVLRRVDRYREGTPRDTHSVA